MNVNKNLFGGIGLPGFSDFRQWFRGKFGYFSREEEIQHEYFPIPRDPPFPSPAPPIITPRYFNRRNFAQYKEGDKTLKLKGVFGGISLEKIHEGARGIGYKLGILMREDENCYSKRKKVKRLIDPPIFYNKRSRLIF